MNVFVASNGMTVERDHNDDVLINRGTESMSLFMADGTALALREFFRAEEDERLGRWRWPENPDYVVKHDPLGSRIAHVLHEPSLATAAVHPVAPYGLGSKRDRAFTAAGRAYFDAHPEPKPWQSAKAGEVWVLDVVNVGEVAYVAADFSFRAADHGIPINSRNVRAGRRIYPTEVAS